MGDKYSLKEMGIETHTILLLLHLGIDMTTTTDSIETLQEVHLLEGILPEGPLLEDPLDTLHLLKDTETSMITEEDLLMRRAREERI